MANRTVLLQGDEAVVEGVIAAGGRFFAGYPITPASEIAEGLARRLPEVGGKFIQMEDEIAGMACIIGASLCGLKAVTATSGPGFSLKQENLGLAIMVEAPCVIVNVQRVGPSTGLPTSPSQGDIMQARWGTHGDHPIITLVPSSVEESFSLTVQAFNLAEKYRIPVILMLDEIVGHMREKIELPDYDQLEVINRKKPERPHKDFYPYPETEDLIPPMPDYGSGYRYHTTGLYHDKTGFPMGPGPAASKLLDRLMGKIERNLDDIILYDQDVSADDQIVVVAYGSTVRSVIRAVKEARQQGIKAGWLNLKTVWPFPDQLIKDLAARVNTLIMPELNRGQLIGELERNSCGKCRVIGVNKYDGTLIKPEEILARIKEVV